MNLWQKLLHLLDPTPSYFKDYHAGTLYIYKKLSRHKFEVLAWINSSRDLPDQFFLGQNTIHDDREDAFTTKEPISPEELNLILFEAQTTTYPIPPKCQIVHG